MTEIVEDSAASSAARGFLGIVGGAYFVLAVWCAVAPTQTAAALGFDPRPGLGQSEYFTVYGGLQAALGFLFLLPLKKRRYLPLALLACVIVHGNLVLFRTISLALYTDFPATIYVLAGAEWLLFLCATALWIALRQGAGALADRVDQL
ncbi:MAG: hypothetical protein AAF961_05780 [Planctomycetota bacterium]